ncbi:MAG: DUF2891 domain-containing protein [Candidatus Eisenbacteria bacterium]
MRTHAPFSDAGALTPYVEMAVTAIQLEFPYHLSLVLTRDADLVLPRLATPVFRGAFDWHSAVHGHWTLVRALRCAPAAPWAAPVIALLGAQLTEPRLAAEEAFLRAPGREGFERPYGLAWLLQLAAECRGGAAGEGAVVQACGHWAAALAPLETLAAARMLAWLERLPVPVRSGEHSQSAFALGLFFDWARDAGKPELCARIAEYGVRLHGGDRGAPVRYEPSAHDFLSPILAAADLLRRALAREDFAAWLERYLPPAGDPDLERWLAPARSPDRADGKFAHLDGLNLSRAWMLEGVLGALDGAHPLHGALAASAARHRDAGLEGARSTHYAGSHWLGSFATYLVTGRGLR